MKLKHNETYFKWGLTAFLTIASALIFWKVLNDLPAFYGTILDFLDIIAPILYGFLFAYLMNPVMKLSGKLLNKLLAKTKLKEKTARRFSTVGSVVISVLVLLAALYALIALIVPNVVKSIESLLDPQRIEGYYKTVSDWLNRTFSDTPIEEWFNENLSSILDYVTEELKGIDIASFVSDLTSSVYNFISDIFNFLIGLVAAVYILIYKQQLCAQAKKLTTAIFRPQRANRFFDVARRTNRIFGNYVIGKIIDALFVGFVTYFALLLMGMPYAPLIGTIVGITNIIPFFGPFLGAVPSALLLLIDKPVNAFYFIVFILILQMIDGNIIENRILGEKLGISDFWVLVSILVFGGIFGFGGMLLGVPVFAVIYSLISDAVSRRLHKKRLPTATNLYYEMGCVEDLPIDPLPSYSTAPSEPPYALHVDADDEDYDDEE